MRQVPTTSSDNSGMYANVRTLRPADGPDEVTIDSLRRAELGDRRPADE